MSHHVPSTKWSKVYHRKYVTFNVTKAKEDLIKRLLSGNTITDTETKALYIVRMEKFVR